MRTTWRLSRRAATNSARYPANLLFILRTYRCVSKRITTGFAAAVHGTFRPTGGVLREPARPADALHGDIASYQGGWLPSDRLLDRKRSIRVSVLGASLGGWV